MSSMLLSSSTASAGESGSGWPSGSPSITRSTLGRSASSRVPGAEALGLQPQRRQGAEAIDHRGQDGGAGGGGQLALALGPDRDAGEQLGRGGGRHGDHAVGGAHLPGAQHRRRRADGRGRQPGDGRGGADDVGDGVVGAHLVEGDAVDGHAVQLRLGLGDGGEDLGGQGADVGVELGPFQQAADLGVVAVGVVVGMGVGA